MQAALVALPHVQNKSDAKEWQDAFMKQYADEYLPFVKNKSNPNDWKQAFMKEYADQYLPHVKNQSDASEWRDAFMKRYADKYVPFVKNKSNPVDWQRAFMKKYVVGHMPHAGMVDSRLDSRSLPPELTNMVENAPGSATPRSASTGNIAMLASGILVLTALAVAFAAGRRNRQDTEALGSTPYLLVEDV